MVDSAKSISEGPREPPKDDTFRQWKQFSGHDHDLQLFKTCENGAFGRFEKKRSKYCSGKLLPLNENVGSGLIINFAKRRHSHKRTENEIQLMRGGHFH